jgi:hypothetical protein
MDKCAVCEKEIPKGSTHCSAACLELSRLEGLEKSYQAGAKFNNSVKEMLKMEAEPALPPVTKKIYIKHRWKKDFNVLMRDTIFVFNGKGIAAVPFVGHVMEDVELLKRKFQGQVAILKDDELDKDPWASDILPKPEEVKIEKEVEEPKISKKEIVETVPEEPKVEEKEEKEEEVEINEPGIFEADKEDETPVTTPEVLRVDDTKIEEDLSVISEQETEASSLFRNVEVVKEIDPVVRKPVKKSHSKKFE